MAVAFQFASRISRRKMQAYLYILLLCCVAVLTNTFTSLILASFLAYLILHHSTDIRTLASPFLRRFQFHDLISYLKSASGQSVPSGGSSSEPISGDANTASDSPTSCSVKTPSVPGFSRPLVRRSPIVVSHSNNEELTSISALHPHCDKSHEEIRLEHHQQKNAVGSRFASYRPTPTREKIELPCQLTSISAMRDYRNKSHDELRLEDYQQRSIAQIKPISEAFSVNSGDGFGAQPVRPSGVAFANSGVGGCCAQPVVRTESEIAGQSSPAIGASISPVMPASGIHKDSLPSAASLSLGIPRNTSDGFGAQSIIRPSGLAFGHSGGEGISAQPVVRPESESAGWSFPAFGTFIAPSMPAFGVHTSSPASASSPSSEIQRNLSVFGHGTPANQLDSNLGVANGTEARPPTSSEFITIPTMNAGSHLTSYDQMNNNEHDYQSKLLEELRDYQQRSIGTSNFISPVPGSFASWGRSNGYGFRAQNLMPARMPFTPNSDDGYGAPPVRTSGIAAFGYSGGKGYSAQPAVRLEPQTAGPSGSAFCTSIYPFWTSIYPPTPSSSAASPSFEIPRNSNVFGHGTPANQPNPLWIAGMNDLPSALRFIVGFNPWDGKDSALGYPSGYIHFCEEADKDTDVITIAEFAAEQHNAVDKAQKVQFLRVIVACLEAVAGGRYHIVLEAREGNTGVLFGKSKRYYACVLRLSDQLSSLMVLEQWLPGKI